jgi:hypothetical protein
MKHYGLHRHFTGGTSVVMFGGGMKKGHIYGEHRRRAPAHRHRRIPSPSWTCTPPS